MVEEMYLQEFKYDTVQGDQTTTTSTTTAQTPTPRPTTTTTTSSFTPAKTSQINAHENDPSFVSINAHSLSEINATSDAAALSFPAAGECRRLPAGDVSLTLGLRHAGNMPEKSPFSVSDFGSC